MFGFGAIGSNPDYPSLEVVVGGKAKAGAFYVTTSGKYLSHIAKNAYGSGKLSNVLRINNSLWNQQNAIYRKKSGSCSSPKVPGAKASEQSSWNPGAWIALCPGDLNELSVANGYAFQVIWVPTIDGKEPWELITTPPPKKVVVPDLPGIGEGGPRTPGDDTGVPVAAPEFKKAGFSPWWLLGLGVAAGLAYVIAKKTR